MYTVSNYRPGDIDKFDILKDSMRAFEMMAGRERESDYGFLAFSFAIDWDRCPVLAPYIGVCDTSHKEALAKGLSAFLYQYSNDQEGRSIEMKILSNWIELMSVNTLLFLERECRRRLDKIKEGYK